MILFIDACVRENSRTKILTKRLMSKWTDEIEIIKLVDINFPIVDETFLNMRDKYVFDNNYPSDVFSLALQFAKADKIVIAAPYWDFSFPACFKQYIEQINVIGVTFKYSKEGNPVGLCKASELYYVTTSGGENVPMDYGYNYVKELAKTFYGINNVFLIKASGLDIIGNDVNQIMKKALEDIDKNNFEY